MGRRRRSGKAINGWVILDKPAHMTSTSAVGAVRRIFNARKAGHAGTLDPLATGVLPIALGEATKTLPFVVDTQKHYQFTLRWGIATNTDDREGNPIKESEVRPGETDIRNVLSQFIGDVMQVPPVYSAIKIGGQRAYDLARNGEDVELEARSIYIDALELIAIQDADHAIFSVVSGKGAYMRGLARDLARALGTVGHIAALCRTAVGPFHEIDTISLDDWLSRLISNDVLPDLRDCEIPRSDCSAARARVPDPRQE